MPIRRRIAPLTRGRCLPRVSCGISRGFPRLYPCGGQVAYVLLTRAPVAGRRKQACAPAAPRLACVKPVASVHPEPGSNSPLSVYLFQDFLSLLVSFVPVRRAAHGLRFVGGVSARPAGPDGKRCLCPDCLSRLYCLMDCRKLTGGSCYGHPSGASELLLYCLVYCKRFNVLSPLRAVRFRTALRSYALSAERQNL